MKTWLFIGLSATLTLVNTSCAIAGVASEQLTLPDLYEASIVELQHGLDARHFTSVDLVKAYFARIKEVNLNGPSLRAVLEMNPSALAQAAALDLERKTKGKRSILHGIPILLKDNIATVASEGMNTTAGSFSLLNSIVPADASVVTRLRKGGAIILGKANLSEFAHVRGNIPNGWSGRGGQATSAYYPNANPCGSSSGSGIATSIGLTAVALGTETDGSITCPSAWNNVVGIKPTLGLTSRAGVIPASAHQDSVGPMARTVADAAAVLNVIAGKDLDDNFTLAQPSVVPDFTKALDERSLKGKRIGVPRHIYLDDDITGGDPSIKSAFEDALRTIRALGATVIDPADVPSASDLLNTNEIFVVETDMKIQLNQYFKSLVTNPSGVRSLADLIKFNDDHPDLEKPTGYEDQSTFEEAEATDGFNSIYFAALASNKDVGATRGLDAAFREHKLDAIVLPVIGIVSVASALAGYPIVTVPLGFYPDNTTAVPDGPQTLFPAPGLPFGLSFLGTAYSEFQLISFAYAYEQRTQIRLQRKAFAAAVPITQLIDVINH
ncbi:amidase signature enzyme [Crucibulum laeve]|uniref:Amidase signature enzyme n=1 Tax=Crucibulum laeve TaxID=68775 RepID=A0A5C3LES1_9AGAR|nr:amidase signature enzyme [Crucibulum laeve]